MGGVEFGSSGWKRSPRIGISGSGQSGGKEQSISAAGKFPEREIRMGGILCSAKTGRQSVEFQDPVCVGIEGSGSSRFIQDWHGGNGSPGGEAGENCEINGNGK
ncbi:hypothetical protein [Akkermansia sp.]|uniref:hypothetical protein n=1 Tax=Akkermansia sp. TaxID=1872421 RepID=UPI0025801999|nr:hypothetical protein [Akkermansia sp.]